MVIESDDDLSTVFHSCGFFLSSEGAKNVAWPWPYLFRGWDSRTISFLGKFVYI